MSEDSQEISDNRLELEKLRNKREKRRIISNLIAGIGKWLLFAGGLVAIFLILRDHTGEETIVKYVADLPFLSISLGTLAIVGWAAYLNERRLRKNAIEEKQDRIKWLEKQIDHRRSSSNITERGETREEDQL